MSAIDKILVCLCLCLGAIISRSAFATDHEDRIYTSHWQCYAQGSDESGKLNPNLIENSNKSGSSEKSARKNALWNCRVQGFFSCEITTCQETTDRL